MNKTTIFSVLMILFVAGCTEETGSKVLVAQKDLQTYATPEGKESYVIKKGEVCAAGKTQGEKVFQYMEVVCPGKGYSWVVTGDPYKLVTKNNSREQK